MSKMFNRARMTITSTGTGALTLGVAVTGYQTFSSAGVSNGDTVSYTIEDGVNWECGTGVFTLSGTTLSRTVTQSYNGSTYGTSPISVTTSAQVFITALAADLQSGTAAGNLVALDGSAKLPAVDGSQLTNVSVTATNFTGTLPVSKGGTGLTSLTAGYIPYGNGTGAFSNSANLTYDGSKITVSGPNASASNWGNVNIISGNSINVANRIYTGIKFVDSGTYDAAAVGYSYNGVGYDMEFATLPIIGGSLTERMRIASDGSVGIGTTSPGNKLQVNGSGDVARFTNGTRSLYIAPDSAGVTLFTGAGQTGNGLYIRESDNTLQLWTNSSAKVYLDSVGNLGLGVTPSAWSAGKAFEIGSLGTGLSVGYGLGFNVTSNAYYNGAFYYGVNGPSTRHAQQSGEHRWFTAPSGTAGNAITFTQAMTLDASGNLGIGTSSPTQKLHIQGTTGILLLRSTDPATATAAPFITAPVTTGFSDTPVYSFWYSGSGISFPAAETLGFRTNSAERMRIDSSGNVGIGTSSPQETLTVAKSSSGSLGPILSSWNTAANANNNAAAIGMRTSSDFTGANVYGGLIKTILTNAAGHANEMSFSLYSDGAGGLAERMRIDTNGNVGIGTTSPEAKLHVSGGNILLNNNQNIAFKNSSGTPYGVFQVDGSNNLLFGSTNFTGAQIFALNGSERARIDSSGNLLVNVTSVGVGKTTIYSTTNSQAAIDGRITASGDVGTRALYLSKFDNNSTTSQIFVQFAMNNAATGQGQINANGANAAAFGTYSDARLKENIVNLPSQLDNILALKPREFDYIESEGGGHQIGFIAQEMQQIYPDAVGERSDGMLTITAWSKTEARLVKAIQELAAKVQALEAKVA